MSDNERPTRRRRARPYIAAVLALAVAGLGHAYLRRWGRAAAWFATIVGTALVLVTVLTDPTATMEEWPMTVIAPIIGLFLLSAVDAYRLAARGTSRTSSAGADDSEKASCPNCGRPVDPELEFCHWCTEPLTTDPDAGDATER